MSCGICQKKADIPHVCAYCGGTFCDEHSLPENHNCYVMSVKNWDTYQKHEIVKGTVPSLEPKKVHKIRETAPEGWTNIEDYDPNPKIIEETKVEEIKKEEPKVEHDEKKYIFYQGRWLTFEEYGKLWEPSEKKAEPKLEYLHDKKPNFLKRIFKRK